MKLRRFAVMDGDGNTLPLITYLHIPHINYFNFTVLCYVKWKNEVIIQIRNGMILCIEVNIAQHTNNSIRLHSQYPSILSMTNDINMFA